MEVTCLVVQKLNFTAPYLICRMRGTTPTVDTVTWCAARANRPTSTIPEEEGERNCSSNVLMGFKGGYDVT